MAYYVLFCVLFGSIFWMLENKFGNETIKTSLTCKILLFVIGVILGSGIAFFSSLAFFGKNLTIEPKLPIEHRIVKNEGVKIVVVEMKTKNHYFDGKKHYQVFFLNELGVVVEKINADEIKLISGGKKEVVLEKNIIEFVSKYSFLNNRWFFLNPLNPSPPEEHHILKIPGDFEMLRIDLDL